MAARGCALRCPPRSFLNLGAGLFGSDAGKAAASEAVSTGGAALNEAKLPPTPAEMELERLQRAFRKSPRQTQIEEKITSIKHDVLKPLDATLNLVSDVTYTSPMVMLIGNHSSGKSTLINYLCGRQIQETGVAPTDDGFTVIRRGNFDMNEDGPTAVNTPAYQFKALQAFGYDFINRFKVKIRTMPASSLIAPELLLVDTPGMIDTPVLLKDRSSIEGQSRGYDFIEAVRWFAQRSDVILLMFDPANPGTTGETLDVLTRSLAGFEHKFLLVLNKVDVFETTNDFARAYGTLCWNLSKVIKLKDIPRIYTTCTPLPQGKSAAPTPDAVALAKSPIPPEEIQRQRSQVIEELLSASLRRLDNVITETEESTKCLLMSIQVGNALRNQYRQREALVYLSLALGCGVGPLLVMGLVTLSLSATALATVSFVLAAGVGLLLGQQHLDSFDLELLRSAGAVVDRLYMGKDKTRDVELRWENVVKPEINRLALACRANNKPGTSALPTGSSRVLTRLNRVLTDDLPQLRSEVNQFKQESFATTAKSLIQ